MLLGDSTSITFPYEIDLLFLNLKRLPIIFCYLTGGLVRYTQAQHLERPKVLCDLYASPELLKAFNVSLPEAIGLS